MGEGDFPHVPSEFRRYTMADKTFTNVLPPTKAVDLDDDTHAVAAVLFTSGGDEVVDDDLDSIQVVQRCDLVVTPATGAAAIASTLAPGVAFRLLAIRLHFSAAPTSAGSLTATLDAEDGAAYDHVLINQSMVSVTDKQWIFGEGYEFEDSDEIDVAYTNPDSRTYGLQYVYERI